MNTNQRCLPPFVSTYPLTPPYKRVRIRRFRALPNLFILDSVSRVVLGTTKVSSLLPIVGFRPIVRQGVPLRTSDYLRPSIRPSVTAWLHGSVLPKPTRSSVLWHLLTSHDKLYSAKVHRIMKSSPCVRETSPIKNIIFHTYTCLIYTTRSE